MAWFSGVSLRTPSRIRAPARCTSRSSSNCRMRFAWYWLQASTVSACARWIAWTTLSSLIFDTARNAEISATMIAMALLKRSLPEAGGVSAGSGITASVRGRHNSSCVDTVEPAPPPIHRFRRTSLAPQILLKLILDSPGTLSYISPVPSAGGRSREASLGWDGSGACGRGHANPGLGRPRPIRGCPAYLGPPPSDPTAPYYGGAAIEAGSGSGEGRRV